MAKRYTDSNKWNKSFFQSLTPKMKLAWLYLCDACNHGGVWDVNLSLMSFQVGENISMKELLNTFKDKVHLMGDKLFIPSFIEFQYGNLNPKNKVHKSIIDQAERLKFDITSSPLLAPTKPLEIEYNSQPSPLLGAMEMDMDMDMEMDKGECEGEKVRRKKFDFESLYAKYPRKIGKTEGIARLKSMIKTDDDFKLISQAIDNYLNHIRRTGTDPQFIKHFTTFIGTLAKQSWRDWLDDDAGKTKVKKSVSGINESMVSIALGVPAND